MRCDLVHVSACASVIILICFVKVSVGRRHCYSCSTLESGSTCLHIPDNVTEGRVTVPCKYYCAIWRQEYVYIPESFGLVVLNRSCEKYPMHLNSVEMDDYFITYYRTCRSHLCNSGDGKERIPSVPEEGNDDVADTSSILCSPPLQMMLIIVISITTFAPHIPQCFHILLNS